MGTFRCRILGVLVLLAVVYYFLQVGGSGRENPVPKVIEHHDEEHSVLKSTPHPTDAPVAVPKAVIITKHGNLVLQLHPDAAPLTVANFQKLASTGWYSGTTLYRYENNFCLQGGGWPKKSSPFPPVKLEYKMPNQKYAVSMARTADPNSATGEFSIMLTDNSRWLGPGGSDPHGYAVFATVIDGFDVIEALGKLPTKKAGLTLFVEPVRIQSVELQ